MPIAPIDRGDYASDYALSPLAKKPKKGLRELHEIYEVESEETRIFKLAVKVISEYIDGLKHA